MINSNLEDTTIVVSSNCIRDKIEYCKNQFGKTPKQCTKPGMDIVMIGSIGVKATLDLAKKYENVLRDKFAASFVDGVFELEKVLNADRYVTVVKEYLTAKGSLAQDNISIIYEIGSEGTFGGLYQMAKFIDRGISIEIPSIPVWQEVIEVAEVFDVNPYLADGTGAIIIMCNSGADMVEYLTDEGIYASVIGHVTDDNDKIAKNGDEIRYLEPTRVEELENLL